MNQRYPRPSNGVVDVQATAETRAAFEAFRLRVEQTGGPERPCVVPLGHDRNLAWDGASVCDRMAAAFVQGSCGVGIEVKDLAEAAARFGIAYVEARNRMLQDRGGNDPNPGEPVAEDASK